MDTFFFSVGLNYLANSSPLKMLSLLSRGSRQLILIVLSGHDRTVEHYLTTVKIAWIKLISDQAKTISHSIWKSNS